MVTDLVQIRRLAAEKADENLAFRRYLHDHHCAEAPFHAVAAQIQAATDCTRCANCCRETRVNVSVAEIEAIAAYLGMPAEAVKAEYTEPDPPDPRPVLRQPDGACVFLDGNFCLIYEARPQACHRFPHLVSSEHTLGSRLPSIFNRASICPIVYNTLEAYKKLLGYHQARH